MKNELLENWLKDNIHFKVNKNYISSIQIDLIDNNNDKMTIIQCFEYVRVHINDEYFNTYYLKNGNWLCKANIK